MTMWRIVQTTDNQHIGTRLENVEKGQVVTFDDGDVVAVNQIFVSEDGQSMVASGPNYQMTLVQE
jgi:Holliday junction resolvasome RuvABC endonuclease subunit